jgi:hypothetical protein
LELLEPVALPKHKVITVTFDAPEETEPAALPPALPVRRLGPMKCLPTRDEIYADRVG